MRYSAQCRMLFGFDPRQSHQDVPSGRRPCALSPPPSTSQQAAADPVPFGGLPGGRRLLQRSRSRANSAQDAWGMSMAQQSIGLAARNPGFGSTRAATATNQARRILIWEAAALRRFLNLCLTVHVSGHDNVCLTTQQGIWAAIHGPTKTLGCTLSNRSLTSEHAHPHATSSHHSSPPASGETRGRTSGVATDHRTSARRGARAMRLPPGGGYGRVVVFQGTAACARGPSQRIYLPFFQRLTYRRS
jgi:hypothetical protein